LYEETIYTDEEVQSIAEKLAEELRNLSFLIIPYLFKAEEYRRGAVRNSESLEQRV